MFVVLHGQTEWNRDGRLQGQLDSPLTAFGKSQSETASRKLIELGCGAHSTIVSSTLGRTLQTAHIVSAVLGTSAADIVADARVREMGLGAWEGLTRPEIAERWPREVAGTTRNTMYLHAPGGESYDALCARIGDWMAAHPAHDDLVVVTHGIASRVLRGLYLKMPKIDALEQDIARDAVYRLTGGTIATF